MSGYTDAGSWCRPHGTEPRRFVVTAPLAWDVGRKGSQLRYFVPVGFEFDVSIPPALCWAFSQTDPRFLKAAALHDLMLIDGWSRVMAGAVFHDALKADGVSRWQRLAMWLAVSLWKYR